MTDNFFSPRIRRILQIIVLVWTLLTGLNAADAAHNNHRSVKLDLDVTITESGDAIFKETLTMPTQSYLTLKEKSSAIKLLRNVQQNLSYAEIEDLQANFDDAACAVRASYTHRGYLRVDRAGQWTLKFPADADPELLSTSDNIAILTQAVDSELGAMSQTMRIRLPQGSRNVNHDKATRELTFEFEPSVSADSAEVDSEFSLDSKPHLMSCLATLYGDESFSNFWASRTVFKNTGSQALKNYRVRSRVAGHSSWSPWARSKVVYPGQTVVDPFFPVFDLNTLSNMSAARPAMIEVEYEYETADGKKVTETDAARIQLLARNQVVYSSREQSEVIDWAESFEYSPFIIASFAHADDPAIQQLAGRISGMANGAAASYTDAEAEAFLTSMWNFLEMNKVAYQSPPGMTVNNTFGQNVKYGRDVLRNRAGTCIDLAILWASTAKAVGLKSYVMIVPGHAFPVIGLPGGNVMPIESTLIGRNTFAEATQVGVEAYNQGLAGDHYLVDIDQLQDLGVRSLDLPAVENNFLGQLGYSFEAAAETNVAGETNANENYTETNHREPANRISATDLVGTWGARFEAEGKVQYMQFTFDGNSNYTFENFIAQNGQWVKNIAGVGVWSLEANSLVMKNTESGQQFDCPVQLGGGQMYLTFNGEQLVLNRTK